MREPIGHLFNPVRNFADTMNWAMYMSSNPTRPVISFYRAMVESINDPDNKGRIKVRLPILDNEVPLDKLKWYNPAISGSFLCLPKVGEQVFVSFEDIENRLGPLWFSQVVDSSEWPEYIKDRQLLIQVKGVDDTHIYMNAGDSVIKVISDLVFIGNSSMNMHTFLDSLLKSFSDMMGTILYDLDSTIDGVTSYIRTHTHPTVGPPIQPIGGVSLSSSTSAVDEFVANNTENLNEFLTDNGELE